MMSSRVARMLGRLFDNHGCRTAVSGLAILLSVAILKIGNAHAVPGPYSEIRTGPNGRCLDVQWDSSGNGTPVQIWDCNGSEAQQWKPEFFDYGFVGHMDVFPNGVQKSLYAQTPNVSVVIEDRAETDNERWFAQNVEIRSMPLPNKCMTPQNRRWPGDVVYLEFCDGTQGTKWFWDTDAHLVRLNSDWNKCLDVDPNAPGASYAHPYLVLNPCNGSSSSQQWHRGYGDQTLHTQWDGQDYCVDIQRDTDLMLYPCDGQVGQNFFLRAQLHNVALNTCLWRTGEGNGEGVLPHSGCDSSDVHTYWDFYEHWISPF